MLRFIRLTFYTQEQKIPLLHSSDVRVSCPGHRVSKASSSLIPDILRSISDRAPMLRLSFRAERSTGVGKDASLSIANGNRSASSSRSAAADSVGNVIRGGPYKLFLTANSSNFLSAKNPRQIQNIFRLASCLSRGIMLLVSFKHGKWKIFFFFVKKVLADCWGLQRGTYHLSWIRVQALSKYFMRSDSRCSCKDSA